MKPILARCRGLLWRYGPLALVCLSLSGCMASCLGLDGMVSK